VVRSGARFWGFAATALMMYAIYLILSGGFKPVDLIFGAASALIAAWLCAGLLIRDSSKLRFGRLAALIKYLVRYFLIYEVRAHYEVAKAALSPSMPIRPGIVEVPYRLRSEYAVLMLANSITNTPGTVTVAVDEGGGKLYVHWIRVEDTDPEVCRELISAEFEEFARRVFD